MTTLDPPLGVALTGYWHTLEETAALVRQADELGYEIILVDGDTALLPERAIAPGKAGD